MAFLASAMWAELGGKALAIQVAQTNGERTGHLVAVTWSDAAHRRADVLAAGAAFIQNRVFGDVPGKDHVGPIAEHQIAADLDAAGSQAVDLLEDARRIEHHAAGDNALHPGAEDAAGNQREFVGLAAGDNRVARIAAPLIANDDVVLSVSRSTSFPLASSPHCRPITQETLTSGTSPSRASE